MKKSAVRAMVASQYEFDIEDIEITSVDFYDGEHHFWIQHKNGRTFKFAIRGYETTPVNFQE